MLRVKNWSSSREKLVENTVGYSVSPLVLVSFSYKRKCSYESKGGFPNLAKGTVVKTASETISRDLYITPIPRSHLVYPAPDGWIYWMSWGTIRAGDCRMEGAKLHLYPDGMIFFQASTVSSSSGDVWLIKSIQFLDGNNYPVGHPIPQHNGMNMAWEGSEYPLVFWDAIPGVTPAGAAQIRSATMTNHC